MLMVQVCCFGNDGDARYRLHNPSRCLGWLPGGTAVDCHFLSRHLPELADLAGVLVMQSINDWGFLSLCAHRRKASLNTSLSQNGKRIRASVTLCHAWPSLLVAGGLRKH